MTPNAENTQNDPRRQIIAHKSTVTRIQIMKNRYGYRRGEDLVVAALDAFEKEQNGGDGLGGKD